MKDVKKTQTLQLWWFDKEDKRYFPAGVAFHDEKFGEYRLKIDMHPENQYYLRPVSSTGHEVHYRVEIVIKKNGKFKRRKTIGYGQSNELTQGDVFMELGPHKRSLVLGGHNDE